MNAWTLTASEASTGAVTEYACDADSLPAAAGAFLGHVQELQAQSALTQLHNDLRVFMGTDRARDRIETYYRRLRSAGYLAPYAYRAARSHVALSYAEGTGHARFDWLTDQDYEPFDSDATALAEEIANLNSGAWEALGCVLVTPASDHAASLWGIVTGQSERDDLYRRDVETELATEAGILPDHL